MSKHKHAYAAVVRHCICYLDVSRFDICVVKVLFSFHAPELRASSKDLRTSRGACQSGKEDVAHEWVSYWGQI